MQSRYRILFGIVDSLPVLLSNDVAHTHTHVQAYHFARVFTGHVARYSFTIGGSTLVALNRMKRQGALSSKERSLMGDIPERSPLIFPS